MSEGDYTSVTVPTALTAGKFALSIITAELKPAAKAALLTAIETALSLVDGTLVSLPFDKLHVTLFTPQLMSKPDKAIIKKAFKKPADVAVTTGKVPKCPDVEVDLCQCYVARRNGEPDKGEPDKVSIYFKVKNQQSIAEYVDKVCEALGLEARQKDDAARTYHFSFGNLAGNCGASVGNINPASDERRTLAKRSAERGVGRFRPRN